MKRGLWAGFLLLVSACASERAPLQPVTGAPPVGEADWARATVLEVALDSFEFQPAHLTLDRQRAYRLHLTNHGGGHNFDAPDFFGTAVFRDDAVSRRVRASGGVIELARGEEVDVYVMPTRAGSFALRCSHPLHASFGMIGGIEVK